MDNKIVECNASTCQYHTLTEGIVKDLRIAVQRIIDGQDQMKETVIHLTGAFKAMERIDNRMDKADTLFAEKNKEQDNKIDELRIFMYKAMGVVTAIGVASPIILKFIGALLI